MVPLPAPMPSSLLADLGASTRKTSACLRSRVGRPPAPSPAEAGGAFGVPLTAGAGALLGLAADLGVAAAGLAAGLGLAARGASSSSSLSLSASFLGAAAGVGLGAGAAAEGSTATSGGAGAGAAAAGAAAGAATSSCPSSIGAARKSDMATADSAGCASRRGERARVGDCSFGFVCCVSVFSLWTPRGPKVLGAARARRAENDKCAMKSSSCVCGNNELAFEPKEE